MNAEKVLLLMEKYNACPNCGNGYIANGEGEIIVEDDYFYRSCNCGWKIKTDEDGNVLN